MTPHENALDGWSGGIKSQATTPVNEDIFGCGKVPQVVSLMPVTRGDAMQYALWIANLIQFGGLALIGAAFVPFGKGRARRGWHPWFLAYGIVVFILGCMVQWAIHAMMFGAS
jgi:hypothetical protein